MPNLLEVFDPEALVVVKELNYTIDQHVQIVNNSGDGRLMRMEVNAGLFCRRLHRQHKEGL